MIFGSSCILSDGGIQLRQLPASLFGNAVGLLLNGIILPQLGRDGAVQLRLHGHIQHAANPQLPHLRGFQEGGQNLLAVFHHSSPQTSMCEEWKSIRRKRGIWCFSTAEGRLYPFPALLHILPKGKDVVIPCVPLRAL